MVKDYLLLMEPIAKSLDKLQGEKNVCLGAVLPCLYFIQEKIKNVELCTTKSTNSKVRSIGKDMQNALKTAFEKRFKSTLLFENDNRDLILAAITHPIYKLKWIQDDQNVSFARRLFEREIRFFESGGDLADVEEEKSNSEDDEFLPRNTISSTGLPVDNSSNVEIFSFLDDKSKDLNMLDKYNRIRQMYRRYNTTLSASSPVERLFSQCLLIFTPRRNRISHENFEKTLLCKVNKDIC